VLLLLLLLLLSAAAAAAATVAASVAEATVLASEGMTVPFLPIAAMSGNASINSQRSVPFAAP